MPTFGAMEMAELRAALAELGYQDEQGQPPASSGIADEGARVPASQALAWFAAAERSLGDPLVGLHAAERVRPRGALVHLIMSAARLRDALDYVCRFSRLLIDALAISLCEGTRDCALRLEFEHPSLAGDRHLADYSLLATSRVLRGAVGEAWRLKAVRLRHAAPADEAGYEAAFGCRVLFASPHNHLEFAREALDVVPRVANPLVARQMEKLAEALSARGAVRLSCAARVSALLRAAIGAGRLSDRAAVARELAMSEATLNRRLALEGTHFRALREVVLWEVADALLANPALKLEAIARSVGFNDAAAFSRALRRRVGCAPSVYRRTMQAAGDA
ncbi:MAG: AraC family transcriptional regulator [Gammaproteobacteria bacterium]|nr:AraC family transcriptional regulator [Gammaproteobacteria bacterium]